MKALLVGLANVVALASCATSDDEQKPPRPAPEPADVSGNWEGMWRSHVAPYRTGRASFGLRQEGLDVTGTALLDGLLCTGASVVVGSVSGTEGAERLRANVGHDLARLEGPVFPDFLALSYFVVPEAGAVACESEGDTGTVEVQRVER